MCKGRVQLIFLPHLSYRPPNLPRDPRPWTLTHCLFAPSLYLQLYGNDESHAVDQFLQSCLILCNPMDCSPPGSSVHGISQARILVWVAISFSRGSSWPRDRTCISCIGRWILYHGATKEIWRAMYLVLFLWNWDVHHLQHRYFPCSLLSRFSARRWDVPLNSSLNAKAPTDWRRLGSGEDAEKHLTVLTSIPEACRIHFQIISPGLQKFRFSRDMNFGDG